MSEHSVSINYDRENNLAVATGGICVAVAFVLSLITVYKMPQGGSVTPASMLPIIFFALCFGPAWGFGAAFIFSLLQMINGYFMMPVQVLLDYTLAFSLLGVAGFLAAPRAENSDKKYHRETVPGFFPKDDNRGRSGHCPSYDLSCSLGSYIFR